MSVSFVPRRAITLDNQLVVLATVAADAGRYHVEAVNEMTGESATSPSIYLSVSGNNLLKVCRLIHVGFLEQGGANWVHADLQLPQEVGSFHNQALLIGDYPIFWLRNSDILFTGYYFCFFRPVKDWLGSLECVELIQLTGNATKIHHFNYSPYLRRWACLSRFDWQLNTYWCPVNPEN